MKLVIKDLDQTRIRYEAMVQRLGAREANLAFARALTKEGGKTFTAVKKVLHKQTTIPKGLISASMKFKGATRNSLQTIISGTGSELPLRLFGAKQFSYGVRAKVWGKTQTYPGNFMGPRPGVIATRLQGNVYHRTSRKRLPIRMTFGPSIPKEMLKDATIAAFENSGNNVMDRAMHELSRILKA
jgi:hypothetical protein